MRFKDELKGILEQAHFFFKNYVAVLPLFSELSVWTFQPLFLDVN